MKVVFDVFKLEPAPDGMGWIYECRGYPIDVVGHGRSRKEALLKAMLRASGVVQNVDEVSEHEVIASPAVVGLPTNFIEDY